MSYKQQLVINQSQRLVLTPQLRQRIEMLQMTKLELGELVSQQLAENPVLEELAPDEVAVPPDEGNIDFTETPSAALNGSGELPEAIMNAAERLDGADRSYSRRRSRARPSLRPRGMTRGSPRSANAIRSRRSITARPSKNTSTPVTARARPRSKRLPHSSSSCARKTVWRITSTGNCA
jgi:DNA-directed RNA polymerase specialized sigma54-like protein